MNEEEVSVEKLEAMTGVSRLSIYSGKLTKTYQPLERLQQVAS